MTYRVRNIVIAVVLAALAALMTSYYVTNYKRHVQQDEKHVTVYVASQDIPAGTSGADAARMLKKKTVTQAAVAPGAVSGPKDLKKLVATQRGYQVSGTANQTLAGILKTGDHVDVVANIAYKSGQNTFTFVATRIVLRNLKVLRAPPGPGTASKLGGSTDTKYPVVLAVTDNQSQKLMFSTHNTSEENTGGEPGWWLELRPNLNPADSPGSVETIGTMLRDGLSPRQQRLLFGNLGGE